MTIATAVQIDDLAIRYGDRTVLSDVSLQIPAGQWTVILGANGAGKSSLLAAIVGIGPGARAATFPMPSTKAKRRSTFIAFVPQKPELPAGMTVAEYVLLGRTAHLGWLRSESNSDRASAAAAMSRLNVAPFADRLLSELSGGEAQRVVLARALCQDAQILVLDEPTASLDVGRQLAVLELVRELAHTEGLTVVSALHDLTSAARYGDNFVLLGDGGVAAQGPADDIMQPALLSKHYGATMHRIEGPDGLPVLVPIRSSIGVPINGQSAAAANRTAAKVAIDTKS